MEELLVKMASDFLIKAMGSPDEAYRVLKESLDKGEFHLIEAAVYANMEPVKQMGQTMAVYPHLTSEAILKIIKRD